MAISLTARPQQFTPVYNPVVYKFSSTNYTQSGFRYIFNVYKGTETIGSFKILPTETGIGYVDISKVLSNFTSVDFNPLTKFNSNCSNSYLDYTIKIGEEWAVNWQFNQISAYISGIYTGYMVLTGTTAHGYVVGTQLNVITDIPSYASMAAVNGLHTVKQVISSTSFIIDALNPNGTVTVDGITEYADGSKTSYFPLITASGVAFNGAQSFKDLINYNYINYQDIPASQPLTRLLTPLDPHATGDEVFYMTPTQDVWFNMATTDTAKTYRVVYTTPEGQNGQFNITGTSGLVKQFMISITNNTSMVFTGTITSISFYVYCITTSSIVTDTYTIYIDNRCKIEDYEIAFMDRMGSILSYSFPLRSKETGSVVKEQYKQQLNYNETAATYTNIYNTWDRGMTINSVNVNKDLELNTNWMNDGMSQLFEELITSPYTWVKIDGKYYGCIVNETSFEVMRQKNKRLIKKTVSIKMANENVINGG